MLASSHLIDRPVSTEHPCVEHKGVLWFASNNATRVILTLRAFRAYALKGLNARKLAFSRQACLNQIII